MLETPTDEPSPPTLCLGARTKKFPVLEGLVAEHHAASAAQLLTCSSSRWSDVVQFTMSVGRGTRTTAQRVTARRVRTACPATF